MSIRFSWFLFFLLVVVSTWEHWLDAWNGVCCEIGSACDGFVSHVTEHCGRPSVFFGIFCANNIIQIRVVCSVDRAVIFFFIFLLKLSCDESTIFFSVWKWLITNRGLYVKAISVVEVIFGSILVGDRLGRYGALGRYVFSGVKLPLIRMWVRKRTIGRHWSLAFLVFNSLSQVIISLCRWRVLFLSRG